MCCPPQALLRTECKGPSPLPSPRAALGPAHPILQSPTYLSSMLKKGTQPLALGAGHKNWPWLMSREKWGPWW